MAANNKANVSTTRGVKGGYFYSAPVGTTDVPTATNFATWTPSTDWENQGYIVEDGFTESVEGDGGEELRDINLDVVDSTEGSYTETVNVGFMEMSTAPLSTIYGHANVTEDNGVIRSTTTGATPARAAPTSSCCCSRTGASGSSTSPKARSLSATTSPATPPPWPSAASRSPT